MVLAGSGRDRAVRFLLLSVRGSAELASAESMTAYDRLNFQR